MNKTYGILAGFFICTSVMLTIGCTKDKTQLPVPEVCPDTISFATQIEPIVMNNCSTSGCHDATAAGGFELLGHTGISNSAGEMLSAMRHDSGPVPMPYFQSKLNDSILQKFDCWIAQGKLNN